MEENKEEVKEQATTTPPKDEKVVKKKPKFKDKKDDFKKKLEEENKLLNEKVLRLSAEMQNMRRHFEDDKAKLAKYDGEKIILELLPIIDNFERAILQDDANLTDEVSKFLDGFKMIYANLVDYLHSIGVESVDCVGKVFDSLTMNAVLIDHEPDVDDQVVMDCMQKGYMYKDKLIRPAMVKVNHKDE